MKKTVRALITCSCLVVAALFIAVIETFFKMKFNVELGLIFEVPIISLTFFIASILVKKVEKKKKPEAPKNTATFNDIKDKVSDAILEKCEQLRGNDDELRSTLTFCVENAFIKSEYYSILFEEFRKK